MSNKSRVEEIKERIAHIVQEVWLSGRLVGTNATDASRWEKDVAASVENILSIINQERESAKREELEALLESLPLTRKSELLLPAGEVLDIVYNMIEDRLKTGNREEEA